MCMNTASNSIGKKKGFCRGCNFVDHSHKLYNVYYASIIVRNPRPAVLITPIHVVILHAMTLGQLIELFSTLAHFVNKI